LRLSPGATSPTTARTSARPGRRAGRATAWRASPGNSRRHTATRRARRARA
jgi:hypothetical protein